MSLQTHSPYEPQETTKLSGLFFLFVVRLFCFCFHIDSVLEIDFVLLEEDSYWYFLGGVLCLKFNNLLLKAQLR